MKKLTTIQKAVIAQLGGRDSLVDIMNHGADAGYPGFTYYADTCTFYYDNRAEINAMVKELANDLGEDPLKMVANFRCLNGDFDTYEVAEVMFGTPDEDETAISNALAWFAAEEVARQLCDN